MKRQLSILLYLLILLALSACGITNGEQNRNTEQVIAFTNVYVVPMTSETVIASQTVLVRGTEIVALGGPDEIQIPAGAQVIDGNGAYLMPGLADMHIHTRPDWDDRRVWPVNPLYLYLANGVTTVRDMTPEGSDPTYALQWRDEIRAGSRIGPTLYTSGVRVDGSPLGEGIPAELVRQNHEQGFDFLKVYSYLSVEDFQAAMREARELGMYTAGHIPHSVGLDGVLAEGMDGIAHIEELVWEFIPLDRSEQWPAESFFGHVAEAVDREIDMSSSDRIEAWEREHVPDLEHIADQLRTAEVPVETTLFGSECISVIVSQPEVWLSRPELKYEVTGYVESFQRGNERHQVLCRSLGTICQAHFDLMRWILSGLHEAGVQLLLGTDSGEGSMGIVPGFSIQDELRILVENGFTPYEALLTGTVNAARVVQEMTGKGDFGTIEVGNRADLILVGGNPLEDLAVIREPLGVMAAGRWYSTGQLAEWIEIHEAPANEP
jgi:imidazolonepropionase-like amidohydrolase